MSWVWWGFTPGRPVGRDNHRQGQSLSFPRYNFPVFPRYENLLSFPNNNHSLGHFTSLWRQSLLKQKLSVKSLYPTCVACWVNWILQDKNFLQKNFLEQKLSVERWSPICVACWSDWIWEGKQPDSSFNRRHPSSTYLRTEIRDQINCGFIVSFTEFPISLQRYRRHIECHWYILLFCPVIPFHTPRLLSIKTYPLITCWCTRAMIRADDSARKSYDMWHVTYMICESPSNFWRILCALYYTRESADIHIDIDIVSHNLCALYYTQESAECT